MWPFSYYKWLFDTYITLVFELYWKVWCMSKDKTKIIQDSVWQSFLYTNYICMSENTFMIIDTLLFHLLCYFVTLIVTLSYIQHSILCCDRLVTLLCSCEHGWKIIFMSKIYKKLQVVIWQGRDFFFFFFLHIWKVIIRHKKEGRKIQAERRSEMTCRR